MFAEDHPWVLVTLLQGSDDPNINLESIRGFSNLDARTSLYYTFLFGGKVGDFGWIQHCFEIYLINMYFITKKFTACQQSVFKFPELEIVIKSDNCWARVLGNTEASRSSIIKGPFCAFVFHDTQGRHFGLYNVGLRSHMWNIASNWFKLYIFKVFGQMNIRSHAITPTHDVGWFLTCGVEVVFCLYSNYFASVSTSNLVVPQGVDLSITYQNCSARMSKPVRENRAPPWPSCS